MTIRSGHSRATTFEPLVILGALAVAGIAGFMLSSAGESAPLLVLAAIGGLVVIRWPFVGLLVFTASIAVENLFILEGASGATRASRLLGMAVFGGWFAGKLLKRESFHPILTSPLTITAGLFFVVALASMLWAAHPGPARSGAIQMVQFIALGILVVDMVRSWERMDLLVKALVIGGALAATLTLQQGVIEGHRRAGDNIAGGINSTAILLVTLIPLAFYLLRSGNRWPWKALGVGYMSLAVPATMLTYSRMNLLLIPLILLFLSVQTLKGLRGRGWLVGTMAAGLLLALYAVPMDRLGERAETIGPYLQDAMGSSEESGIIEGSSRGYHLRLGFAIARDNPVLGAGFRNYGHLFREEYQFTVPGAGRLYGSVRSPHSSHVGMLADLGLVGLALWLGLALGLGFLGAVSAWRRTAQDPEGRPHLLAQAITVSIGLQVFAYGWYTTIDRDKLFWLLLGLAVAATMLSRAGMARPLRSSREASPRLMTADGAGPEASVPTSSPSRRGQVHN
jgi:hypothetical protein